MLHPRLYAVARRPRANHVPLNADPVLVRFSGNSFSFTNRDEGRYCHQPSGVLI